ncbi:MAG: hypothetical protein OXC30_03070 [Alphaproteobacteria bacterium]|nr:hypothetical protein [Alphaproteobacteria bacterium]
MNTCRAVCGLEISIMRDLESCTASKFGPEGSVSDSGCETPNDAEDMFGVGKECIPQAGWLVLHFLRHIPLYVQHFRLMMHSTRKSAQSVITMV